MSNMNPMLLQKQLRDNSDDLQEYFKNIKVWGDEMKRKEESLRKGDGTDVDEVPIPRNNISKVKKPKSKSKDESDEQTAQQTKQPKDYGYWEKFDVDAECEKLDKEKSDSDSELSDEIDESMIELAMEEKEKGNKFVKAGRYEDAIKCYTNAIDSYSYDPVFYANRALCHLKLKRYKAAESDCTTSLQIDKEYVKALHRRALAREALGQFEEAAGDLDRVLKIDSSNLESRQLLDKIRKKGSVAVEDEALYQRPLSKFTLSRKKAKEPVRPEEEESKPVEAFRPNVYERINPRDCQPSTSKLVQNASSDPPPELNWPSGADVELVSSVTKTPKERSKQPLKRVQIFDVDLKTELKLTAKPIQVETAAPPPVKTLLGDCKIPQSPAPVRDPQETQFENLEYSVDLPTEDGEPVPTTSVQFYQHWKYLDPNQRFYYLRRINPTRYASIFKDSLESKVFSEIIAVLAVSFIEKNVNVFEYLYGLTKVKRFGALVMFKSAKDKGELLKLIDFMRTDERWPKEQVDYLIRKYEM